MPKESGTNTGPVTHFVKVISTGLLLPLAFSHERCALEQQCDRARQCGDADVTSIDVHKAPMATVGVDSGWGLGRHAIPALVPLGENARRKLQGWGDSHSAQPATAIETQ